jgi:hypothetical protein
VAALLALLAVVAAAGVGVAWRRGDGTTKRGSGERIRPAEVALDEAAFGARATLLFFTADHDERSVAVRGLLEEAAAASPGVLIAPVDLGRRGDLAGRYAVTTIPTVFVLDGEGRLRFRLKGAARRSDLLAALESVAPAS